MKKNKTYKAVFRTKIDFVHDSVNDKPLLPGGVYYFDQYSDSRVSYSDIVNESVQIINTDLKAVLQKYIDIPVKEIHVQAVYEGSIEILFFCCTWFSGICRWSKELI